MKVDPPVITIAVEGDIDEAVALRLVRHVGAKAGTAYGKAGKDHLRRRIRGYNEASRRSPWLVIVDLDQEDCGPALRRSWLSEVSPSLCFRVAVREVEAWLLADAGAMARFLSVPAGRIPSLPESLADPKGEIVRIARRSRSRAVREAIVPRPESERIVGPEYTSSLSLFARDLWCPDDAALRADSLRRAIRCLTALVRASHRG